MRSIARRLTRWAYTAPSCPSARSRRKAASDSAANSGSLTASRPWMMLTPWPGRLGSPAPRAAPQRASRCAQHAHYLGGMIGQQGRAATGAAVEAVRNERVGRIADHPAVLLVPRLGAAGLGLLAPVLAVRARRFGRGARRLLRSLQLQHQLNQLVSAEEFKVSAAHDSSNQRSNLAAMGD